MDAKALYRSKKKEFLDNHGLDDKWLNELSMDQRIEIFSSCIVAEAITNSRDMICQKLDELIKAVRVE